MSDFVSEIKTIPFSVKSVYAALSDMSNLEKLKDRIPSDKISDFSFDSDSCSFSVSPVGKIRFSVIEREPLKTVKLITDRSPVEVTMWIQLVSSQTDETKLKLTVRAGLSPFLKPMVSKPLQEGIDKIADILATIPYSSIDN